MLEPQNSIDENDVIVNKQKYVSLAEKIRQRSGQHAYEKYDRFFSVEFFPARTPKGALNWIRLVEQYADGDPLYCDITWHVAGNPGLDSPTSSLTMANVALNYCQLETMLHITCIGLTCEQLGKHLERAKNYGIRNILALRGDRHGKCVINCHISLCVCVGFLPAHILSFIILSSDKTA